MTSTPHKVNGCTGNSFSIFQVMQARKTKHLHPVLLYLVLLPCWDHPAVRWKLLEEL